MTSMELFLELARPDPKTGVSRWVDVAEFKGKYSPLVLGNGLSWGRKNSQLQKKYVVRTDKSATNGRRIKRIKLDGYKQEKSFSQAVRPDIKQQISSQKCVMLGVSGRSENTKIEVDHKDGRKDDMRVSDPKTQSLSDFQPLCKAANDIKRQICKECRRTGVRWDARKIQGNPFPFYAGTAKYEEGLGCVGCYQYDPVAYRKYCVKTLLKRGGTLSYDDIFPEG